MGEEVKITVIATGFRDPMPERRKRLLEVEDEIPVVSIPQSPAPVAQISLVPRNDEIREPAATPVLTPVVVPVAAPKPVRFMSQVEEEEQKTATQHNVETASNPDKWDEAGFFSNSASAEESVAIADPPAEAAANNESEEMEWTAAPAPPKFAELAEEPTYTPQSMDYAPPMSRVRGPATLEENRVQPAEMLFPEADEETDLEKPTFLRNLQL
jgi:cell division protein FtsZ